MLPRRNPHPRTLPLRIQYLRRGQLARIAHRRLMCRRKPVHRPPVFRRAIHPLRAHQHRHMLGIQRMPYPPAIRAPQVVIMDLQHCLPIFGSLPWSHLSIDRPIPLHHSRFRDALFKQCRLHRAIRSTHLKSRHKPFQQHLLSRIAQTVMIGVDLLKTLRMYKNSKEHSSNRQQPKYAPPLHPSLPFSCAELRAANVFISIVGCILHRNAKIRSFHLVCPARFVLDSSP